MDGITRITNRFYIGGDPCYSRSLASDLDLIHRNNLVVIDCRSLDERQDGWDQVVNDDTTVVYAPLEDDGIANNDPQDFIRLWDELRLTGLEDSGKMVHCHMGVNRAPSVAMFLMLRRGSLGPAGAFNIIRNHRTGAGIAYASVALKAHLLLEGTKRTEMEDILAKWETWEDRYWTPDRIRSVNEAVRSNRSHVSKRGGTWIDDRGMVHAINVES